MISKERRILFVSSVGCGPPYHGNRARVKSLLAEIRKLGFEIDFAGVVMSSEEKKATLPYVDRWVADFDGLVSPSPPSISSRILGRLRRLIARFCSIEFVSRAMESQDLDRWFASHWHEQLQRLQKNERYQRVLVSYVFHSAFLNALPRSCVRILDTHDVFGGRKERMQAAGLDLGDYWFTVSKRGERKGLLRAHYILAIQDREAKYFRNLVGAKRIIATVGHFVEVLNLPFDGTDDDVIGFLASENSLNVSGIRWFLDKVFPIVQLAFPTVRLRMAGKICDAQEWPEGVESLGMVENVEEFHRHVLFTINPMQAGSGLKIKTVESLAYGRAVVASPTGADGLSSYLGQGLAEVHTATAFAEQILSWLNNPDEAKRQGALGSMAMEDLNQKSRDALRGALGSSADRAELTK